MNRILFCLLFIGLASFSCYGQKTVHVFVALCDNQFQGIVPVPKKLGNGKDPHNNLYWGAAFGVKNYFKNKTNDWDLVRTIKTDNPFILERLLFKHKTANVFMLADAYDGERIKECTENFLKSSNWQLPVVINYEFKDLKFGGKADLITYSGHDGLMDFKVNIEYKKNKDKQKEVIILACFSKSYFKHEIKKASAIPLLWTTHLMAPEAYSLKSALDGWILKESANQIKERAAQSYHKYQHCGIKGARNLFTVGF